MGNDDGAVRRTADFAVCDDMECDVVSPHDGGDERCEGDSAEAGPSSACCDDDVAMKSKVSQKRRQHQITKRYDDKRIKGGGKNVRVDQLACAKTKTKKTPSQNLRWSTVARQMYLAAQTEFGRGEGGGVT